MANPTAVVSLAVDNDANAGSLTAEERRQRLRMIEALVFASAEPVGATELAGRLPDGTDVAGLLRELQERSGLSLIFITHDFGIVARMCKRAAVMYAGKIVETAHVRELFNHPGHPYTQALMQSVPKVEEIVEKLYSIEGQPPPLHDLPPGCTFAPRCPDVSERCRHQYPPSKEIGDAHYVSCWNFVASK